MRRVINGRFLGAPQTGVQRVASNLILGLDRLLAEQRGAAGEWVLQAPRGTHRRLPLRAMRFQGDSLLKGQAWEQLELPLSADRAGLINLCNIGPLMAPSALTLIHDAQVYLSPQSYSPAFAHWYRLALPRLAASSRCVVTVSEFSKAMLARFGVAPLERIQVVPNGADHMLEVAAEPGALARLGLPPGAAYVFAFGSLQPHKNLGVLLRAFARPQLRGLRLVVSGGLDSAAVEQAFEIAPSRNVLFAGRLTDGEIRALLEAAVCLACPSTTEGFGLPPLEAMILGCPAVVAPAGAMPEVCGAAASYAPPDDAAAWAAAIGALAGDASGRAGRSRRVRAHAAQYSWRRSAERLHDLVVAAA
ncbi:glycosyltransferase family 1 protein [Phenylobacterium sp. LjRoot219]|uniref:glycosyltransferase family 4 protein n=1 Tax=Phenylobacterium sp. LjRoot219 TaxID=3342283 RepID=UPI003ECF99A7